jgi:hypothetical protein
MTSTNTPMTTKIFGYTGGSLPTHPWDFGKSHPAMSFDPVVPANKT